MSHCVSSVSESVILADCHPATENWSGAFRRVTFFYTDDGGRGHLLLLAVAWRGPGEANVMSGVCAPKKYTLILNACRTQAYIIYTNIHINIYKEKKKKKKKKRDTRG